MRDVAVRNGGVYTCWYAKAVAASRVYSPGVREINRLGPTNLLRQSGMELNSIFTDASDLTDCLNAFSAFCDKPRERERESFSLKKKRGKRSKKTFVFIDTKSKQLLMFTR
jgi:hypothetical protein